MANQATHVARAMNAAEELERTIKGFHSVTNLLGNTGESGYVDIDNLFYLLDGIGTNLQQHFTELNQELKAVI